MPIFLPCFGIIGAPTIVVQPLDQSVVAGNSVVFTCEALAYPLHHVAWLFNSSVHLLSTNDISDTTKYSINRNRSSPEQFGSLTVNNVQYEDHGLYQCTAVNSVGNVSASAALTVHGESNKSYLFIIKFEIYNY